MSLTKATYFLVHRDTGQRYPIMGSVTIGRIVGDIVFSTDTKLSNKHCTVTPTATGLAVSDLHSANGTAIDGIFLSPERVYLLKPKSELTLGEQGFILQTVSVARKVRRRVPKRRQRASEERGGFGLIYLVLIALIAWGVWNHKSKFGPAPVFVAQAQLAEAFQAYQRVLTSIDRQSIPPEDAEKIIQVQVLAKLGALNRRWAEMQPLDNEQRQLYKAQLTFASALTSHARVESQWLKTGDNKLLADLDLWSEKLAQASVEMHQIPRSKTAQNFPSYLLSPLQMVEKEMRQAIGEYKKLGNAVQAHEVTEKQMGESIRHNLIPQMNAVYARMGAIIPQSEVERRKVVLEQKLLTAFLGQLKAMSLSSDTKEKRYAQELDNWTAQLEKINTELKEQVHPGKAQRSPAQGALIQQTPGR